MPHCIPSGPVLVPDGIPVRQRHGHRFKRRGRQQRPAFRDQHSLFISNISSRVKFEQLEALLGPGKHLKLFQSQSRHRQYARSTG